MAFMGAVLRVACIDVAVPMGTSNAPMKWVNSTSRWGLQSILPGYVVGQGAQLFLNSLHVHV